MSEDIDVVRALRPDFSKSASFTTFSAFSSQELETLFQKSAHIVERLPEKDVARRLAIRLGRPPVGRYTKSVWLGNLGDVLYAVDAGEIPLPRTIDEWAAKVGEAYARNARAANRVLGLDTDLPSSHPTRVDPPPPIAPPEKRQPRRPPPVLKRAPRPAGPHMALIIIACIMLLIPGLPAAISAVIQAVNLSQGPPAPPEMLSDQMKDNLTRYVTGYRAISLAIDLVLCLMFIPPVWRLPLRRPFARVQAVVVSSLLAAVAIGGSYFLSSDPDHFGRSVVGSVATCWLAIILLCLCTSTKARFAVALVSVISIAAAFGVSSAHESPRTASLSPSPERSDSLSTPAPTFVSVPGPRKWKVPGDYSTIQAAIDAAKAGDTVVVGPGLYLESLKFKDGISLKGAGYEATKVRADAGTALTCTKCTRGIISGFTFDGSSGDSDVVSLAESSVTIDNCNIEHGKFGLFTSISMDESADFKITVTDCVIRNNARDGVRVAGQISTLRGSVTLVVSRSAISNNEDHGIVAFGRARCLVTDSACDSNQDGAGMFLHGGATAVVEYCKFRRNNSCGITCSGEGSHCEIKWSEFDSNTRRDGAGIKFMEGAKGSIENSTSQNNNMGIIIFGAGTRCNVADSNCNTNMKHGIVVAEGARATVSDTKSTRNGLDGIYVCGQGTDATISDTTVTDNTRSGIFSSQGAAGTFARNTLETNGKCGLLLTADSNPRCVDNVYRDNKPRDFYQAPP